MGIGMALGGVAKGFESAEGALAKNKALGLQEQQILGDQKLRERALGIQEQQLQRGQQNDLLSQANKAIGDTLKLTADTLKATEGQAPEVRLKAVEPLLAEIDDLGGAMGKDTTAIKKAVIAQASVPANIKGAKPPSGYRYTPEGDLEAIPGGPATKMATGDSGRLAMLKTAKDGFDKQAEILTKEWSVEDIAAATAGVGDIGRAQRQASMMIESAVRAASGGTVREDEIAYYEGIFMPKVTDSKKTRKDKIAKLQAYAERAENIATQGRGSPEDAKKLAKDVGADKLPSPPASLAGRPLQWNSAMNLFRDKSTGEMFNANGEPVASQ